MATTIKDRIYDYSARNRVPLTGAFELSPICNFSCRMCYVRKTPEEVKQILDNGTKIAKEKAQETMKKVKTSMKINY